MSCDPIGIEALEGRLLLAAQQSVSWRTLVYQQQASATGSISGQVFRDNNSNGALDAGETGVNGVTVFLDLNNTQAFDNGDASALTTGSGNYSFTNLADGTYSVGQVNFTGYLRISAPFQSATVASGGNVIRNWFDFPTVLTGSNGTDQWLVRMDPNNATRFQCLETLLGQTFPGTIYSITKSLLNSFTINAQSGDDMLTIDYSVNGNPIPIGGFNYDAANQSTPASDRVTITGTGGPDNFNLTDYDIGQGNGAIAMKGVENVTVTGGAGVDTLSYSSTDNRDTITLQGGDIVYNGISTIQSFNVENEIINTLGGNDLIPITSTASGPSATVNGGNGNDTLEVDVGMITPLLFNGGTLITDHDTLNVNIGTFDLNADAIAGTPNLTANVGANGTLVMNASQHLEALSIAGEARLAANGGRVLVTKSLSITGGGKLDLTDNDLVIDYTGVANSPLGTWTGNGGMYTGICGYIQSGYDGDDWDGKGINTSAHTSLTGLGCAEASEVLNYQGGQTALFGTEPVDATAVLVKYTYSGDANLDGKINVDDYLHIDYASPIQLKVWNNGDFNYDGKINIDDYLEIDFVVPIQGQPL
jgi:hypothetical protein